MKSFKRIVIIWGLMIVFNVGALAEWKKCECGESIPVGWSQCPFCFRTLYPVHPNCHWHIDLESILEEEEFDEWDVD